MLLLAWVLTIVPLDSSAPPAQTTSHGTEQECQAARETFIKEHMYSNWQGLKMGPLVRTTCAPQSNAEGVD